MQTLRNMTQELVYETLQEAPEEEEDAGGLTICENCNHRVPKTMLCLYCGSPILFKMPRATE